MTRAYQGEHRDNTPRPACDCDPDGQRPVMVYGRPHGESCAIVVERNTRLHVSAGGAR